MQFYASGVYDQPSCSAKKVNHAVLIIGYGTDDRGKDYWTVKNRYIALRHIWTSLIHTHTLLSHTFSHMHTLSLSHAISLFSFFFSCSLFLSLSLSLSLSHTHTHTHTLSLSLKHTHTLSLSLQLGCAVGREWLHTDVKEPEQSVWHSLSSHLPHIMTHTPVTISSYETRSLLQIHMYMHTLW